MDTSAVLSTLQVDNMTACATTYRRLDSITYHGRVLRVTVQQLLVDGAVSARLLGSKSRERLPVERGFHNHPPKLVEALARLSAHSNSTCRQPQRVRQHPLQLLQTLLCLLTPDRQRLQLCPLVLFGRTVPPKLDVHRLCHGLTAGQDGSFAAFHLVRVRTYQQNLRGVHEVRTLKRLEENQIARQSVTNARA